MAKTKLALYDGDQISFFKADQLAVSALSYIKNLSGNLVLQAESGAKLNFKSSLLLDTGLVIGSAGSSSTLTLGNSGDIINLNASGVTYNIGTLTGSPVFTGNITTQGSGTNTFSGTTNFTGNVNFSGTTVELNVTNLTVDDKNIELGSVGSPTDITADGGGITLKGATDKTIIWDNANDNWTSSEHWNLATGKLYKINNISLLGYVDPYTVSYQNLRIINTSTTNTTRFLVEGNNGQLFAIVDDLSDSLLSVNDISGLPILEVFAADKVVMGKFGSNTLVVNSESVGIGTATPQVPLHIAGTTAALWVIRSSGDAEIIVGEGTGANQFGGMIWNSSLNQLRLVTQANQSQLVLDNATGNIGIGTTSPTFTSGSGLHISNSTQANLRLEDTGDYFDVANSDGDAYFINRKSTGDIKFRVNTSLEAMTIIESGYIGVGTTIPLTTLHIVSNPTSLPNMFIDRYSDDFIAPYIVTRKGRGTSGSPSAVLSGDDIGGMYSRGYTSTGMSAINSIAIKFVADETFTSTGQGTYMRFDTTQNASTTRVERMRITSNGNVGIGTTSPTAVLHLKAGTASANTAPIKFTAGTNLATPEAGAVEWDGSDLYITQTAGPSRKALAFMDNVEPITTVVSAFYYSNTNLPAGRRRKSTISSYSQISLYLPTSGVQVGDTHIIIGGNPANLLVKTLGSETVIATIAYRMKYTFHVTQVVPSVFWQIAPSDTHAPFLIGGTFATSTLTLRTTSAAGTAGADMIFQVGNNGDTEAMRILNSGNIGINLNNPQYKLDVNGDINIAAGSSYRVGGEPLTNESVIKKITQNSHGLSVGNAIRINSSGVYVKAQADSVANAEVVGIVQEVVDANTFKVVFSGMVTAGVPAQPPGTVLFLSDSSAGALSTTEPSAFGRVSKPVAVVTASASAMVVMNMRGMEIAEDDALGEYFDVTNVSNPTFTAGNLDNVILCDCTNNEIIINLPSAVDNQGKIFYIKKIDSSLNDAVVTPINGELIDDYVTYPLELRGEYVQIISNNVNWMILSD